MDLEVCRISAEHLLENENNVKKELIDIDDKIKNDHTNNINNVKAEFKDTTVYNNDKKNSKSQPTNCVIPYQELPINKNGAMKIKSENVLVVANNEINEGSNSNILVKIEVPIYENDCLKIQPEKVKIVRNNKNDGSNGDFIVKMEYGTEDNVDNIEDMYNNYQIEEVIIKNEIRNDKDNELSKKKSKRPFQCRHCKFNANSKNHLVEHGISVHSPDANTGMFYCMHCLYSGRIKHHLRMHLRLKHINDSPTEEEILHCNQCSYTTTIRSILDTHESIHKKNLHSCSYCDFKSKSKIDLYNHMPTHQTTLYTFDCSLCDFKSKTQEEINMHNLKVHEFDDSFFNCKHCDYKSKGRKNVNRHMRVYHVNGKTFDCPHCNYTTKTKSYFKDHMRYIHSTDGPTFNCTECDFKAKKNCLLQRHMVVHQNDARIYKCNQCNFQSKVKSNFQQHMIAHDISPRVVDCPPLVMHKQKKAESSKTHKDKPYS